MDQVEGTNRWDWRKFISGGAIQSFLILGVLFVLPLLAVPGSLLTAEIHKKFLLSLIVFLSLIFWLAGRLSDGLFVFPKGFIVIAALAVLVATAVSGLLSPVKAVSLAGLGYEFDTFLSLSSLFVLFLLSSVIFQNLGRLLKLAVFLALSFLVGFAVWVIHLAFDFNWLGLTSLTSTLVGGWNDFGIFAGLTVLVALFLLESGTLTKNFKLLAIIIFSVASLVLLAVNYNLIWWGMAGLSLAIFLQSFFDSTPGPKRFLKLSLIVFLISTTLAVWGVEGSRFDQFIDRLIPTPLEVRPSWGGTLGVARIALSENPIWGVGPNRFASAWVVARPAEVNQGSFWNVDFSGGVGHLSTLLVTSGPAGAFFWILFVGIFAFYGLRAIVRLPRSHYLYTPIFVSFWGASFLWFFFIVYLPLSFITALTFVISGVFLACLIRAGLIKNINFSASQTPTKGFLAVLAVLILVISSVSVLYLVGLKWRALAYFQKGFDAFSAAGDLPLAEEMLKRAIDLDSRDLYFRQMSEVLTARLRLELSLPGLDQETLRSRFISTYGRVLETAAAAKKADPTNYLNVLTAAGAYEVSIPLGNSDAYDLAKGEYQEAARLNPTSPIIPHRLAQLELLVGNRQAAKENLGAALTLKSNFTPALLLFSQIEALEGDIEAAIQGAELALASDPNSLDALFQLGVLSYRGRDWERAIEVLEKAVSLQTNYANARYFLGLSYERVGRQAEAVKIFEDLSLANPENANVKQILSNLKTGRNALSGLAEPETFGQTLGQ